MDRRRAMSPVITRQFSNSSSGDSLSPASSPAHHHSRHHSLSGAGGLSTIKRNQNEAAKAAARRLAQAMATQAATDNEDEGDEEDDVDLGFKFRPPTSRLSPNSSEDGSRPLNYLHANLPAISGRTNRAPSPALGRNFMDLTASVRSTSTGRTSTANRTAAVVPPSKNSVRTPAAISPIDLPTTKYKEKRSTPEIGKLTHGIGQVNLNDRGGQQDASALLDELDMLQGENETIRDQLRRAEVKREEAEARARQLEQQVASLGDGVSLEAKLLSRKEAALRQREAALKAAKQKKDGKDGEIATLRSELENLKIEAETTADHLQDVESEAKNLRIMTQRMILTQEEMEEVVLKRCWLARYWGLAVQLGICSDIAVLKHEHWSAFAPLPFEVVFSAGQKAKEDYSSASGVVDKQGKSTRHQSDLTGDGNIESMLSVEMGLRELASLKIEDAVVIAMAQCRRPNFVRDYKAPNDPKLMEAYELNQDETQDVTFKQAWLIYFWKRARDHGVEEDIAEEKLQYWISRSGQSPLTSHDAVDVDRGLIELRKVGIEQQLWEASRKEIEILPFVENGNHNKQHSSESEAST